MTRGKKQNNKAFKEISTLIIPQNYAYFSQD